MLQDDCPQEMQYSKENTEDERKTGTEEVPTVGIVGCGGEIELAVCSLQEPTYMLQVLCTLLAWRALWP